MSSIINLEQALLGITSKVEVPKFSRLDREWEQEQKLHQKMMARLDKEIPIAGPETRSFVFRC